MGDVILERRGSLARLRLNRPAAINALTHAMVGEFDAALDEIERDPQIAVVLLSGEGERGLCAGGDIRSLYDAPRVPDGPSMAFWRDEYRLDARIARFPKPFVAFMDGLVMGGGIGISAHAAIRIATERSRIAMPEVGIGFIPDVGGTFILARAPGELGTFMALTGRIIAGADARLTGFTDHLLVSESLDPLANALSDLPAGAGADDATAVVRALAVDPGPALLVENRAVIDACFSQHRVEDIVTALATHPSPFAAETLRTLAEKSPTSLKLALAMLRHARHDPDLESCLERDFAAARAVVVGHDFYEGIRAAIIDKDRNPTWRPDRLEAVSDAWVDEALAPTDDRVFPDRAAS